MFSINLEVAILDVRASVASSSIGQTSDNLHYRYLLGFFSHPDASVKKNGLLSTISQEIASLL